MANLIVIPETGLADEPMQIKVTGLQPSQKVTIRLTLKDDKGQLFQSRAFYEADDAGEVSLDKTAALGGTYQGVYPMGLVWSLKPLKPFQRPMKKDVANCPFEYTVDLFDSLSLGLSADPQPTLTKTCTRWHMAPGIQKTQIKEGRIRGTLFYPTGEGSYPGIIDLFGGGGGLAEYRASLLASHGFVVLALAYFAYSDLPQTFQKLHLEYFEEAVDLLLKHPKVSKTKVGVLGVSKGAEVALVLASYLPRVGATVSINGTCYVYGGSIYHEGKVIIKGTPYVQEKMVITADGFLKTAGFYEDSPASSIPVERAQGHILYITGEADQYFNSKHFAKVALSRMKKHGRTNGRMISYPGAGHQIEPPGFPFCWASSLRGHNIPLIAGGEMIPHCEAEESVWREIQLFFRQHLNLSSNL
ncbi:acyl-coenzyme A amino acid N-acyltransferase 1-like [Bufo bufo]|uniref:acyl-coenzyme A amino acid N-acyltransferase 1-like n=1 Tax=Bufo bufo TaxID=8384 RepID=UPI001ABDAAF8|nr:acyl-coenzyme A amino acid N-acyltransferase 1-like [Bufo bufo]